MTKNKQPEPYIVKTVATYQNEQGRQITEASVISGKSPKGFSRFIGVAQITVRQVTRQVTFGIHAETIKEAFENADAEFDKVAPGMVEQLKQSIREHTAAQAKKIVVPGIVRH